MHCLMLDCALQIDYWRNGHVELRPEPLLPAFWFYG